MLRKTLKSEEPRTRNGSDYSQHELDFYRQAAEKIAVDIDPELRKRLDSGQADLKLRQTVRSSVDLDPSTTPLPPPRLDATNHFGSRHPECFADQEQRLYRRRLQIPLELADVRARQAGSE